jgi:tetratricopeptide (TPR) repeat protein
VELLLQAALLQAGPLGDLAVAEAGLEQVLELVPDHAEARAARARVCRAGGDFARAAGLFVEAAAREPDAAKKAQLFAEAGVMAEEQLGDEDRAVELYVQALSADPRLVAAAERLARIYVARGRWAKAEPILDMLVGLSDPSGGDTDSQVAMQLQLAGVAAANGNVGKALAAAAEAYRLQPESLPVLRQYADLLARRQEWKQAGELYGTLLRLHRAALPPTEIRDVLLGGGQCRAELGDNEDAIGWYEDAVAIDSGHRPAIEALARLHAATQDWASWLEDRRALVTIAAPEEHPGLLEEIADAQVQHLADGAGAEATYQAVLNLDPGRRSTRKKLLELFTRDKRWQQAAEALVALAEGEEDAAARAEQLGGAVRMWRDQLQQPADSGPVIAQAIAAYEALTAERQGEVAPQEALAELYLQAGPEAREKAIAAHQRLLAQDPNRLASYQALAKLYGEVGAADKQWCLAATLTFFKKAGPELETIYKRHRPARVRVARHRFDDELWLRARHPDEDRLLDALFVLVGAYAAEPAAHGPAALGLLRRKRVDPAQDSRPQVRALVQLAKTFDVPTPELFLIDGEGETEGATTIVNLRTRGEVRPTLILGPTTLARTDEFELVFDLGKHMAFLRPERFLRFALGTPSALDLALRAILALAGTPIGPGAANGETARLTAYLRRTVPSQLAAELAAAGRKLLDARGPHIDLDRWIAATDLSAARAALVVAGDLEAAARVIWSEPAAPPALTSKERLKDLIAFSISEDYFACRSQLGLGVR